MAETKADFKPYLAGKLRNLSREKPEYHSKLVGSILEWGASVGSVGTVYDSLQEQILYQAQKRKTSPDKVIDDLFEQPTPDKFMHLLQA